MAHLEGEPKDMHTGLALHYSSLFYYSPEISTNRENSSGLAYSALTGATFENNR